MPRRQTASQPPLLSPLALLYTLTLVAADAAYCWLSALATLAASLMPARRDADMPLFSSDSSAIADATLIRFRHTLIAEFSRMSQIFFAFHFLLSFLSFFG